MIRNISIKRKQIGFSLVELMIIVTVVAILAAVGFPAYGDHVRKTHRSKAKAALSDAASQQEQFFLNNKTYTTDFSNTGINFPTTTEAGLYVLSAVAPTAACPIASCYVLQAVPQAPQNTDSCGTLTYDSNGTKLPANNCW